MLPCNITAESDIFKSCSTALHQPARLSQQLALETLQADMDYQGSTSAVQSHQRVLLLPTVIINTNQYRGRLDVVSITRALCAGFDETTEPDVCLSGEPAVSQPCMQNFAKPPAAGTAGFADVQL